MVVTWWGIVFFCVVFAQVNIVLSGVAQTCLSMKIKLHGSH